MNAKELKQKASNWKDSKELTVLQRALDEAFEEFNSVETFTGDNNSCYSDDTMDNKLEAYVTRQFIDGDATKPIKLSFDCDISVRIMLTAFGNETYNPNDDEDNDDRLIATKDDCLAFEFYLSPNDDSRKLFAKTDPYFTHCTLIGGCRIDKMRYLLNTKYEHSHNLEDDWWTYPKTSVWYKGIVTWLEQKGFEIIDSDADTLAFTVAVRE